MKMVLPAQKFTLLALSLGLWLLGSVKCESRRPVLRKPLEDRWTGCYFIVLKDKATEDEMQDLMNTVSKLATGGRIYNMVHKISKAFTVKLSPYSLELVRRLPAVDYIEEEGYAVGEQIDLEWHLDRLDQVGSHLDSAYRPIGDGEGVDVYILDSGINYDHEEFEYRAKYTGIDPTDEYNVLLANNATPLLGRDCHGHGTHVASLCGGKTYGSAKKVTLYSVRVLGCDNSGPWSVILRGLEHAVEMAERTHRPSILSMSWSGGHYQLVEQALTNVINRGLHAVAAAGNGQRDACTRTPARNMKVITVGGTRRGDGLYLLGSGTNFGGCVDIFAPGERILAADWRCENCSKVLSGTSMSAPLVSGLAAIKLSREPLMKPDRLKRELIEEATLNIINFQGINEDFREATPNRLVTIKGMCGEKGSSLGRANISSPNFPGSYPPHLDCRWEIGGEEGIRVRLNLFFINLEQNYDVLRVYDGCCGNQSGLVREFTGNIGHTNFSFSSTSTQVCVEMITDGFTAGTGFNGSYIKFYAGTDLVVPDLPGPPLPPLPRSSVDMDVTILMSPRQARDRIKSLLRNGYKLTWISSYRLGPDLKPYFDFIATNSSRVDTKSVVEIGFSELNRTIYDMKDQGYYIKLLIDRIRGKNPTEPSYSVIFEPRAPIFETEHFLRDSFETYKTRLATMTRSGYRLISHSFCSIRGQVEVTSVYIRDRRIAFNIPTPEYPDLVIKSNLTFFEFTDSTIKQATRGFYPASVEVFKADSSHYSYFSVIYEERDVNTQGNWFRWSLNTTAARDLILTQTQHSWDVLLTTGYTYLQNIEHFVEFRRKG